MLEHNSNKLGILECTPALFENSHHKNKWIANNSLPYLGFANIKYTNSKEIKQLWQDIPLSGDYDCVAFCENGPDGAVSPAELLFYPKQIIMGFYFRRSILKKTGIFNEYLHALTNFDFLLRVAEQFSLLCVPASSLGVSDSQQALSEILNKFPQEFPYLFKRAYPYLQENGNFELALQHFSNDLPINVVKSFFNSLKNMFQNEEAYMKIECNTAPILFLCSDGTCYGVLQDFVNKLCDSIIQSGQAARTTQNDDGTYMTPDDLYNRPWKAIIGFQSILLEEDWIYELPGIKIQFWFDNPLLFDFRHVFLQPQKCYYLCQDADYANYLTRYFGAEHAVQFPPAGTDIGCLRTAPRNMDVVFLGSYPEPTAKTYEAYSSFEKKYYHFMIAHPNYTFEQGLQELKPELFSQSNDVILSSFLSLRDVCLNIIAHYRYQVIETILNYGIPIHVFGSSWNRFPSVHKDRLIIHDTVSPNEAIAILQDTKISINIMSWHKTGMTERIANSMLAGAVCVSDETTYLKENFEDGNDIILYSLNNLNILPGMIQTLLNDDERRKRVSQNGYQKAQKNHTWNARACELIHLIEQN